MRVIRSPELWTFGNFLTAIVAPTVAAALMVALSRLPRSNASISPSSFSELSARFLGLLALLLGLAKGCDARYPASHVTAIKLLPLTAHLFNYVLVGDGLLLLFYGTRPCWSNELLQPINVAAVTMAMGSTAHLSKDGWDGEGVPCFFGLLLACASAALGSESSGAVTMLASAIAAASLSVAVWQRQNCTAYVLDAGAYSLNTEMTPSFHPSILLPTLALILAGSWLSGMLSGEK